ncbi:AIPR family protein [Priestia megaterium]|uniref:AIPR family protein n=1 Tax=Priestia megaterium TaxID=1404 RepID=UPI000BFC0079|nr:AIPR family protein [Priestia megaterium]PGN04345.1 hypothetical protein CN955_21485 [Priestia megaterium]
MQSPNLDKLTPVTFKCDYVNEMVIAGQKTLQMVVRTDYLINTNIPNNANSRGFTGNKNRAFKAMVNTIRVNPESFRFKNLGVSVVASDFIKSEKGITLFFSRNEGIFNGGHTYEVVKRYGNSKAYIYVNIEIGVRQEHLVDISVALNMSKKLEDYSRGEKMGAHEWIKQALPVESVIYKEGDSGEYHVTDILKVANIFKVGKGNKYLESSLPISLLRKAQIIRENNEKQTLSVTRFLLPDIWQLYKSIRKSKIIQKNFPHKFTRKNELLQGMCIVFLYGVQYMTVVNKNNIPVWKEGYSPEKALKICEKVSGKIGKLLNRPPYIDTKAEWVYREAPFQDKIRRIFADELL